MLRVPQKLAGKGVNCGFWVIRVGQAGPQHLKQRGGGHQDGIHSSMQIYNKNAKD